MATAEMEAPAIRVPATDSGPQPRKWTREEYHRLGEHGYFDGQRVELIEGEIFEMSPINWPHALACRLVSEALETAFGAGAWASSGQPIPSAESEPQPDVAMVTGRPRDYVDHPTRPLLIVEVSDSTLWFDLGRKAVMYAQAGHADYWVVDLNGRRLIVHRSPGPGGYADVTAHPAGAAVEPLARPGAAVAVNDLLP